MDSIKKINSPMISAGRKKVTRPVGALLSERRDRWQVGRRYMSRESLKKVNDTLPDVEEVRAALPDSRPGEPAGCRRLAR